MKGPLSFSPFLITKPAFAHITDSILKLPSPSSRTSLFAQDFVFQIVECWLFFISSCFTFQFLKVHNRELYQTYIAYMIWGPTIDHAVDDNGDEDHFALRRNGIL